MVSRILGSHFPEFRLVTPDEVSVEARDYHHKRFPRTRPTCVASDFDGNGDHDYGIIALEKETGRRWFLLIFGDAHRAPEIRYRLDVGDDDGVLVSLLGRGSTIRETTAIPGSQTPDAVLEHDGVLLTYYGKAAIAYFWNSTKRRVEHIQVSD